jgi:hypothetical protein
MRLWHKLYLTVWLAFFSCILPWLGSHAGPVVHLLLGLAIVCITLANARSLAALPVPARLKRISKVTAGLALFQIVSGLALGVAAHFSPGLAIVLPALRGAHAVCALAILAQSSSVATAYDMWEEKEFARNP